MDLRNDVEVEDVPNYIPCVLDFLPGGDDCLVRNLISFIGKNPIK